ncbi:MAG: response regulator [Muribaculaceae bacterium]|nr:response regulator [Muribaculaceae bacterium]
MILIIDDDSSVRLSIGLVVRRCGYDAAEASSEAQALVTVRDTRVKLVILDMNLGLTTDGRQGIEMLRKIKILRPDIPVILLTGWGTIPLAVEGMKYGAADFVTKPWDNDYLRTKIKRLIADSHRTNAEARQVDSLESVERNAIIRAIDLCDGNLSLAAQKLGITRQALYRRIEKYGL